MEKDHTNIGTVIDLILTLPSTSVKCETAFSQLKLLKTCRRSNLSTDVLNDLMTVKLMSPPISQFQPEEGIEIWLVNYFLHCFVIAEVVEWLTPPTAVRNVAGSIPA